MLTIIDNDIAPAGSVQPIPALGDASLLALILLLGAFAMRALWRR